MIGASGVGRGWWRHIRDTNARTVISSWPAWGMPQSGDRRVRPVVFLPLASSHMGESFSRVGSSSLERGVGHGG